MRNLTYSLDLKNLEENKKNRIAFIYKSNDDGIRGILIKEKNSYFVELSLDKHKYYDDKRSGL